MIYKLQQMADYPCRHCQEDCNGPCRAWQASFARSWADTCRALRQQLGLAGGPETETIPREAIK